MKLEKTSIVFLTASIVQLYNQKTCFYLVVYLLIKVLVHKILCHFK